MRLLKFEVDFWRLGVGGKFAEHQSLGSNFESSNVRLLLHISHTLKFQKMTAGDKEPVIRRSSMI